MTKINPLLLIILDGFGVAPPSKGNAIYLAEPRFFDFLVDNYPALTLQASGEMVGLPWGEMGNSEVGHLTIGGGKVLYQNLPRITRSIMDGSFFENPVLKEAASYVKKFNSKLHIVGLVSWGGVHSSQDHLDALLEFCQKEGLKNVVIHAILDGRDTPPNAALDSISHLIDKLKTLNLGKIASLSGRFYAMDRDKRWMRTYKAYLAIVEGKSETKAQDPLKAIKDSYSKGIYDEEFEPTVIGPPFEKIEDNDVVIIFNFRPDRVRQLTHALVDEDFKEFNRPRKLSNVLVVTFTEYEKNLPVKVVFPPEKIEHPIADIISQAGLKQFHIAETEKYPHVTYFLNGGREKPYPGEDRLLIPSPRVPSYAQKPEMSAFEVTEGLLKAIQSERYSFLVVNFANPDMVGHTGDLKATIKAIKTIDQCLKKIINLSLEKELIVIVTADHGNAESMIDPKTGLIDKEHTSNPVPFLLIGKEWYKKQLLGWGLAKPLHTLIPRGILADIAPTLLNLMGLKPHPEMTGRNLLGY